MDIQNKQREPWFSIHAFNSLSKRFCGSEQEILDCIRMGAFIPIYVDPESNRTRKLICLLSMKSFIVVVQDEQNGEIITILDDVKLNTSNPKAANMTLCKMLIQYTVQARKRKCCINLTSFLLGRTKLISENLGVRIITKERVYKEGSKIKVRIKSKSLNVADLRDAFEKKDFIEMVREKFKGLIKDSTLFCCLMIKTDKDGHSIPLFWKQFN